MLLGCVQVRGSYHSPECVLSPCTLPIPQFDSRHFPGILDDVWDSQYGWVEAKTGQAMVVGEWGGSLAGDGKASTTQRKLGEWLVR
jgi:hypothetical protein